ncbi:MAG: hypothetical protein NTX88_02840 [Candidatus Atribacteria bacterium]|nr:hypothetical protein [Candidatus Atribacteria bacterium]
MAIDKNLVGVVQTTYGKEALSTMMWGGLLFLYLIAFDAQIGLYSTILVFSQTENTFRHPAGYLF